MRKQAEEVGSTDKEVQDIFIELDSILFVVFIDKEEEEVFFDNEDKEVEEEIFFINLDNIDLDNILFVFFQVGVWWL